MQTSAKRKSSAEPPLLWLVLMAGSIAVHSVLAVALFPTWNRLLEARPNQGAESAIPIGFVELPAADPPPPSPAAPSPAAATTSRAEANPPVANAPSKASKLNAPGFISQIPAAPATPPPADPELEPFITPASAPIAPPVLPSATGEIPQGTGAPEPEQPASAPDPLPSVLPSPPVVDESGFPTVPIDVPVPDVSEQLALPQSPDPDTLAQTEVSPEATPVSLVATVTVEPVPDLAENLPETIAAPAEGATHQELSDPLSSPCASVVTPMVVRSLGTVVAIQVATNATGQVGQTTIRESSQNPDYDALAQCAAQNWQLTPATVQGEPTASNALLMRITIDRGEPAAVAPTSIAPNPVLPEQTYQEPASAF